MTPRTVRILLAVVVLTAPSTEWAWGARLRAGILQQKLDRIYFDTGEEALVFAGSPFTIYCGKDSLFSGVIETSYEGVSISTPLNGSPGLSPNDGCYARLETAEIESRQVMSIGTVISYVDPVQMSSTVPLRSDDSLNRDREQYWYVDGFDFAVPDSLMVELTRYPGELAMQMDFAAGKLDGFLCHQPPADATPEVHISSSPAPVAATLLPNIGRKINRQGLLTTALYYRYDPSQVSSYFDGANVAPMGHFLPTMSFHSRLFPYDPEAGKKLLKNQLPKPRTLRLYAAPELKRLAAYFADLLARQQCRTEITSDRSSCDLYLEWVRLDRSNASAVLMRLTNLLAHDTSGSEPAAEQIRALQNKLALAMAEPEPSLHWDLLREAERMLIEEIGCFPLFRPSWSFVSHRSLVGPAFTAEGLLDLPHMRKIKLPQSETAHTP
jgi:hypothetical protein